ncbi:DUF916 and DUF3324 domain-containing protein [Enterococcus sp. MSG3310]|uniref:DUF916 and DUF3324 domain-containing protein n=1 Tax=Enterococcus sp. MSG3310 TaxID=2774835 RepID=UPI003D2FEC92
MKIKIFAILLGIAIIALFSISKQAEATPMRFSVEPVIEDNQLNKEHTYFDLLMNPNQEQILKINMRNNTDENLIIIPDINTATTNINGVVEYGSAAKQNSSDAKYRIEDIVKTSVNEITIPSNGQTTLELEVKMPSERFKGLIAGGITLHEKDEINNTNKNRIKEPGLSIENKYAYVLAIVLQEDTLDISSELKLTNVEPSQLNSRNVIKATIQNPKPMYVNQLSIDSRITKRGDKKVLYKSKKDNMQLAPNSSFDYPISLNGEKLKPGKFTLELLCRSSDQTWKFTRDFEIKEDVSKKLNKTDVSVKNNDSTNYMYTLLALVVILILFIIIKKFDKHRNL